MTSLSTRFEFRQIGQELRECFYAVQHLESGHRKPSAAAARFRWGIEVD